MSTHDDDTCPHLVVLGRLEAENARLKAEVEAIHQEYSDATNHYNQFHNNLQAHIERLTKAGDAMAEELNGRYFGKRLIIDWNAAKEGKSQP